MSGRERRKFTPEQKAEAVALVHSSGKSIYQISKDLDLSQTALRRWVKLSEIEEGRGPEGALKAQEREELRRLRRENRILTQERDFLKKAAAFFAKDTSSFSR